MVSFQSVNYGTIFFSYFALLKGEEQEDFLYRAFISLGYLYFCIKISRKGKNPSSFRKEHCSNFPDGIQNLVTVLVLSEFLFMGRERYHKLGRMKGKEKIIHTADKNLHDFAGIMDPNHQIEASEVQEVAFFPTHTAMKLHFHSWKVWNLFCAPFPMCFPSRDQPKSEIQYKTTHATA